mgnify:FL=1
MTSVVLGPILGQILIICIFYWFSLVKGFQLGPIRPEALGIAYGMSLMPSFIGGCLLGASARLRLPVMANLAMVGAVGFVATWAGTVLVLGLGDVRGATLAGVLGVLPAYGCWLTSTFVLNRRLSNMPNR